MATVRKRPPQTANGKETWVAYYQDRDGQRRNKGSFRTKREAQDWLDGTVVAVKEGRHTPASTSITVKQAGANWLRGRALLGKERSTLRQYQNHLDRHIDPSLGGLKLAQLTAPRVAAFRDELLAKPDLGPAMVRKVLASLKALIRVAQEAGQVAQNVALAIKVESSRRDKRKQAGRDFPTKAEINRILDGVAGRWRPLMMTAIYTGMRSSELRGLTWDDVDFPRAEIHVRQRADRWAVIGMPKSEAGVRVIPMTPELKTVLASWKLMQPLAASRQGKPVAAGDESSAATLRPALRRPALVFANGNGNVENHANIANRGFYALQTALGIIEEGRPRYGFHALRHFFASWALDQGISPKRLQALLGHSTIQMTIDHYSHLFPSEGDEHARFAAGERALRGSDR